MRRQFDGEGMRFSAAAEVRIHTTRIAYADHAVYTEHGVPWSLLGNTAQARLTPSVVEHYEARGNGVELTWLVRERGTGDLTIDAELDGLLAVAETGGAVQLVDASGGVDARIGAAQVVDAKGQRFPVETEVLTGGVRWRASADVLAQAEFPVAVDP